MEISKRSRNFTVREKMLLVEVAKEFVSIIDNKKTDGTTIESKKQAWKALAHKYNAVSETGSRTEKQLHALYDNLKKTARKNMSGDKSEMYKTGGGTFCPKTTVVDEQVVALLTTQFKPLNNEFDSSAPYNSGIETHRHGEDTKVATSQDYVILLEAKEKALVPQTPSTSKRQLSPPMPDAGRDECSERLLSTSPQNIGSTPKPKKMCLTEIKKNNIKNLSASIIKRKTEKQVNEDLITSKRLEILEIQRQHELIKLEKTKTLLDLEIELKTVLLENAKMDMEFKRKNFNL